MNKKIKISIVAVIVFLVLIYMIIPYYLRNQPDTLLRVEFACTTGQVIEKGGLGFTAFDNGTHTIDMVCCTWEKNEEYMQASLGGDDICPPVRSNYAYPELLP